MARALWSGAISFGLVNVPVKLFRATPSESGHGISFHRLHAACGTRIQQVRRCPRCQVDVPWEDVVNGYEYARGRYAVIKREELPRPQEAEQAAIAIEDFVVADDVDPLLFDRAYWVGPDGPPKAYALLHRALVDTGRVAIARVVVRTRSHLAVVRPVGEHLVLTTLFFADEMTDEEEIPSGAAGIEVTEREAGLAEELIGRMTVPFDAARYPDTTTAHLREMIEEKIARKEVAAPGPVEVGEAEVVDIMEALRRSVEGEARRRAETAASAVPAPAAAAPLAEERPRPARRTRPARERPARPTRKSGT